MNLFAVVLSLSVATYARCDISLTPPSGSYLPGVTQGNFLKGGVIGGLNVHGDLSGGNFIGTGIGSQSFVGGDLGSQSFSAGSIGGGHFIGDGGHAGLGFGGGDHKQIHFYAAPDEYQDRLRIYVTPNSARNTKVIFVKAPSFGALSPEIIAPPSVTEDRTKVYVLVKKPESGGAITIPSSIVNKPTKPEVFFVKYRTEQEAQAALSGGLQEGLVGSHAPDVGNAQAFLRTLGGINGGYGGISGIGRGDFSGAHLLGGVNTHGKYGPPGASGPY